MAEEKKPAAKTVRALHNLITDDRKTLTAAGVSNVDNFDDQTVVAYTDLGEIVIRGRNPQIDKLNTKTGELTIAGETHSVTCTNQKQSSRGGVFSKMFRQWGNGALGFTLEEQGQGFLMALTVGFALGTFYDVLRILRVSARSEKRQVTWQDIFVCFVAAVVSFPVALAVNWGEARLYLLAGEAVGMRIYFLTLGEITFRLTELLLRILAVIKDFLLRWILRLIRCLFRRAFHRVCTIYVKIAKATIKLLKFRKKRKKSLKTSPSDSV